MRTGLLRKIISVLSKRIAEIRRGQIGHDSEIGRWLYLLSSLNEIKTIVEIGTWNGLGSSKLIAEGVTIRGGEPPIVLGFEVNPRMATRARRNLRRYTFFKVIWGTLIDVDGLQSNNLENHEQPWFLQDKQWVISAPKTQPLIPDTINLCVLDGGEFSTYAEFVLLKTRIRGYLLLDDTNTRKCKQVMNDLITSDNFQMIWSSTERNGTALFKSL